MGPSPSSHQFRFLQNEVAELEKLLKKSKGRPSSKDVRKLVTKFSKAHKGRIVQDKQVQHWFWNKRYAMKKQAGKTKVKVEDSLPIKAEVNPRSTSDQKDSSKLEFEARSSRDNAWYDVKSFLAHRMLDSGDPEVRVRFVGFGPDEDEWVNVRSGVRERSLPCEASECVCVIPGDLILCFKEGNEQALYYDAHVIEVDRRRHDIRGCRCRFLVQYDHDGSTDIVPLRKVCRRPETEYRHPPKPSSENASIVSTKVLENQQPGNLPITTPETQPLGITSSTAIPYIPLVSGFPIAGTEQHVALTPLAAAPNQAVENECSAATGNKTMLPEKQYIDLTEED